MRLIITSIRLVIVTMLIVVAGYTVMLLGLAKAISPESANGSLIKGANGVTVGSRLIAQNFTQPGYFWPRPSAVDFNASAAGGSNKSPTSSDLTDRARKLLAIYGASPERPLPADLAAASGCGLDPDITEHAALYQAERIANARGMTVSEVESMIQRHAFASGGYFTPDRLVNVLELNLALEGIKK